MAKRSLISILFLFSCSTFVTPYDPAILVSLAKVNNRIEKVSCKKKNEKDWRRLDTSIQETLTLSSWRRELLSEDLINLQNSIGSAYKSKSVEFCESMLKIQKERIWQIGTIWGKR